MEREVYKNKSSFKVFTSSVKEHNICLICLNIGQLHLMETLVIKSTWDVLNFIATEVKQTGTEFLTVSLLVLYLDIVYIYILLHEITYTMKYNFIHTVLP